jgi:hypothetical protein
MEQSGQIERWNRLYDEAPADLRFQIIVWGLIAVAAVNMLLTIWFNFPFGLLLLAALATLAWIRIAPRLPMLRRSAGTAAPQAAAAAPWSAHGAPAPAPSPMAGAFPVINTWLDGLPEFQRLGLYLAVLGLAGVINMLLSIDGGFPFGVLFLIALVAIAGIRGPWVFARTRAMYEEHRAARRTPAKLLPRHAEGAADDAGTPPDAAAPPPVPPRGDTPSPTAP